MQDQQSTRNLGIMLLELGRIDQADIERALEHQRIQGGYFGQALVDLGIVQQEELDFSLAEQARLPYVRPSSDNIDPDIAGLVPPTWATRHNAMPIAREDGWLTLLVDSPLKSGLAVELTRRTGLSVKLALCSSQLLRDTIRTVYKLEPVRDKARRVLSLEAFWTLASSPSATSWGLTVRRDQVTGWIDADDAPRRYPLVHNWLPFLDGLLSPAPSQLLPAHGMRQWRASVRPDQSPVAVTVTSLSGPGGHDLLFVPDRKRQRELGELPGTSQIVALREAIAAGKTVVGVRSPTGLAARNLITRLPRLLLRAGHRSVCLFRDGAHAISEDILVVTLPENGGEEETLSFLGQLKLDAVGLEISPTSQGSWERALTLAPLTLLVLTGPEDDLPPPGIGWLLSTSDDQQPQWTLDQA